MQARSRLTLAVLVVFGGAARPAAASEVEWTPGVGVGMNLSTFHADGAEAHYGTFQGFYLGGSISASRGLVGLRSGLTFTRRGFEIPADPESVRIDYLELPLMVELRPQVKAQVRPVFLVGVSVARRLGARSNEFPDWELDEAFDTIDVGAAAGLALQVQRFAFEGQYTWGLSNAWRSDVTRLKATNRCWSLGLRLLL